MKKLVLSFTRCAAPVAIGLMFATNLLAQSATPAAPPDPNAPVMKFDRDTIDYGTIPHNSDGYRTFTFTNVGKEPLIIKDAHGSCGCTIPTAPKEPIQPGQTSEIKVHYATDRVGGFTKYVTITSNANPSTKVLTIHGNVLPDPSQAKPASTAPAPGTTPVPAPSSPH